MSVLIAKVGRSGAGGANSDYITRLSAAEKIAFYNLEHLESKVIAEARTNAIAYAHAREEIELARGRTRRAKSASMPESNQKPADDSKGSADSESASNSAARNLSEEMKPATKTGRSAAADEASGDTIENTSKKPKKERQVRTHYRLIASWEGRETSENAVAEVKIFLEKQFPKARAVIAVHQDTDDTHAHIWIDARQTDGKKIHLKEKQFQSLDEKWTEQYDRRYGTNYAPQYKALKLETKQWKREMYQWRKSRAPSRTGGAGDAENAAAAGGAENADNMEKVESARSTPPKPPRAADRFKTDYWKEKEVRQITGAAGYEKINAGTSHSDAQRGDRFTQAGERFAETGDQFTRRTELADEGTERSDRSEQSKNGGDERFGHRTEPHFAGASRDGAESVRADGGYYQAAENGRAGFAENEIQPPFDDDQSNVYSQRIERFAEESANPQISSEQLYENRYGLGAADGSRLGRADREDFAGNSTVGEFHLELSGLSEMQFEMPQLQMDAPALVGDTLQLIQTSLERRQIEMNEGALALYHEHLTYTAESAPSSELLKKIAEFNDSSGTEDKFIKTENKSWLAANHEYLSSLSARELDREAVNIAEEFEEDLKEQQKFDPDYQESRGMTL